MYSLSGTPRRLDVGVRALRKEKKLFFFKWISYTKYSKFLTYFIEKCRRGSSFALMLTSFTVHLTMHTAAGNWGFIDQVQKRSTLYKLKEGTNYFSLFCLAWVKAENCLTNFLLGISHSKTCICIEPTTITDVWNGPGSCCFWCWLVRFGKTIVKFPNGIRRYERCLKPTNLGFEGCV